MRYVGLDVHKKVIEAAIMDEGGKVVDRSRFASSREAIDKFIATQLKPDDRVVLEATTNTWAVVDLIEPHVAEVVVSNPLRTRAIAEAKIKTDKVDATVLAHLLRCDYLPPVWAPDALTRKMRHLSARRAALVSDRTRLKNRIHAVLHQRLIAAPTDKLFSKTGLSWLRELDLDELGRAAVDSELRLLEAVEAEIEQLDGQLATMAYEQQRAKLLMTMPGVSYAVAISLLCTLGDISRFDDGDHAASYLGLVPSTRASANNVYHGPITKQGRSHARWMMVQAAQHLDRHPGPLGVFFRRMAKKKNRNVAVVATARKMVTIAYHMLTNNEPYRYAIPAATDKKLAEVRVKTTGKRRKRGPAKGARRAGSHGSGKRTRAVPSIDRVYEREELPPTAELSPGEQRTVRRTGTQRFVRDIHRDHRVERVPSK